MIEIGSLVAYNQSEWKVIKISVSSTGRKMYYIELKDGQKTICFEGEVQEIITQSSKMPAADSKIGIGSLVTYKQSEWKVIKISVSSTGRKMYYVESKDGQKAICFEGEVQEITPQSSKMPTADSKKAVEESFVGEEQKSVTRFKLGSVVNYNGSICKITAFRNADNGKRMCYLLSLEDEQKMVVDEDSLALSGAMLNADVAPKGLSETTVAPKGLSETTAREAVNTQRVSPIVKSGGYLYLNFLDNLDSGLGDKHWGKEEFYTMSLKDQYEVIRRRLGRYAPDSFQEFITRCFPKTQAVYCISMPAFDREIQSRIKNDGSVGNKFINNVVIRPDLSDVSRRKMSKIPTQYDVIIIGDITFGNVISFTVKGIELIDSKVAKFGELRVSCTAACAFSKKTFSDRHGNSLTTLDYGVQEVHDATLTNDFIDKLCTEVYPIPQPYQALSVFEKWKKYLDFRNYYLGVQSQKSEELDDVFAINGYVVSKSAYNRNKENWEPFLLHGHKEFERGEQVVLDKFVEGADEFAFICVAIEKNRKEVLLDTMGKNGKGKPKYEVHLKRYTKDSMGLSPQPPQYDAGGQLVKGVRFRQYLLGERFAFTYTDIEPDYTQIENDFDNSKAKIFAEIDRKYASIVENDVKEFMKTETPKLTSDYAQMLDEYIKELAESLENDVRENKDKEVRDEYDENVTKPIEDKYVEQISGLNKEITDAEKKVKDLKKSKKKLSEDKDGDELATINESLDELDLLITACKQKIVELEQKKEQELESAQAMMSISYYYEARNERRIEERRKSLGIALKNELVKKANEKKSQLTRQYQGACEAEKKAEEQILRQQADERIAEKRENETVRRYEIYFRPENPNATLKDINKEIGEYSAKYLTFDNRAEKAKIDRQKKALESFRNGYVKNPFLASYLFAPQMLSEASHPILDDPEWCLESLNDTQKKAVRQALASDSIFLLQGPPGTGKTQVISELTAQLVKQGKKVLISSETHKAIDNVFERLPKIPEIRPLRLIPSQNNKVTNYSPERLVDNFYLNIQENLRKQVDKFEHFNEMKDRFKDEMEILRLDYGRVLKLKRENAKVEVERKRVGESINRYSVELEELREQIGYVAEQLDEYTRTVKYIESYRFSGEGVKLEFTNKYRTLVEELLSKYSCFEGKTTDNIRDIVNADIELIKSEIESVLRNGKPAEMRAERDELKKLLDSLRDPETDDPPMEGDEHYDEFMALRGKYIELGKLIKEAEQNESVADVSDGELSKLLPPAMIADKNLIALVPEQIRRFKAELTAIISNLRAEIENRRGEEELKETELREKLADKEGQINEANARYRELSDSEGIAEHSELSSQLKQKIGNFFRSFGIIREYDSGDINGAIKIVEEEWSNLESNYKETKEENERKIPIFKDICKYLDSPDILEEDRQAYTKTLYDNVNVFGITCTSRDRFSSSQLNDLERYKIGDIDIRKQGIDVVIIDEVSKSSFLDLLIPILYGKTVILVGDHRQLPPMYDLRHMRENDFEGLNEDIISKSINDGYTQLYEECFFKTLYEKIPQDFKVMLNKQYRCHSHIMQVFNHFYGGNENGLVVGTKQQDDFKQHNLSVRINDSIVIDPEHHIYFVDCDEKEESEDGSTSKINKQEADVVMKLLESLNESAEELVRKGKLNTEKRNDERPSVGVICTYGDQASLIKKRRKTKQYKGFSGKDDQKLVISTVDDFQGDERDVILVSMVRNPKDNRFNAEFVKQFERINVAFSRARKMLIIVGARKFLSSQTINLPDLSGDHAKDRIAFPVYKEIIDTIGYKGRILTANEIIGE